MALLHGVGRGRGLPLLPDPIEPALAVGADRRIHGLRILVLLLFDFLLVFVGLLDQHDLDPDDSDAVTEDAAAAEARAEPLAEPGSQPGSPSCTTGDRRIQPLTRAAARP